MSSLEAWKKKERSPYVTHLGLAFKEKKKIISAGSFCFQFKSSPVTHDKYLSISVFCSINRLEKKKKTKQAYVGSLSFQQHSLWRRYYTDKTANSTVLHSPEDRLTNSFSLGKNPQTKIHAHLKMISLWTVRELNVRQTTQTASITHTKAKHQKGHTSSGTH